MLNTEKIEDLEKKIEEIKQRVMNIIKREGPTIAARRLTENGYPINASYLCRISNGTQTIKSENMFLLAEELIKVFEV